MNKKYKEGYVQGYEDAVKTEMMYKEEEKQEPLLGLVHVVNKGQELIPHKDYEIKQDGEKFYLVKKKKEYPKTFLGCCDVLGIEDLISRGVNGYRSELLDAFQKLLICRDVYWKIAGEEMGLDKPWKPDWTIQKLPKYCIAGVEGQIKTAERYIVNTILAFPTAEMRDAFYEVFREEIEICKELL